MSAWTQGEYWGWTSQEMEELKAMYPSKSFKLGEICKHFNRSRGSIAGQAKRLDLKRPISTRN